MGGWIVLAIAFVTGVLLVAAVSFYIYYGRLYMRARVAGGEISFGQMLRMTTSGLSAYKIVTAFLEARRAGVNASIADFERFAVDGKDPLREAVRLAEEQKRGAEESDDAFVQI